MDSSVSGIAQATDGGNRLPLTGRRGVQQRLRVAVNQEAVFAGIARVAVREVDFGANLVETVFWQIVQCGWKGNSRRGVAAQERIRRHEADALRHDDAEIAPVGKVIGAESIRSQPDDGIAAQFRRNFQHVGDFWLVKEAGTVEQNRAARRKLVVKQPI